MWTTGGSVGKVGDELEGCLTVATFTALLALPHLGIIILAVALWFALGGCAS